MKEAFADAKAMVIFMKQAKRALALLLALMMSVMLLLPASAMTPEETIAQLQRENKILSDANLLLQQAVAALAEANRILQQSIEALTKSIGTAANTPAGTSGAQTGSAELPVKPAADPIKSVYSESEREKIAKMPLDEARGYISTFEDAAHYLHAQNCALYSCMSHGTMDFSLKSAMNGLKGKKLGCETADILTAYLLSDDYSEIGLIAAPIPVNGSSWPLSGVYVNQGGRYTVATCFRIMRDLKLKVSANSPVFSTMQVASLSEIAGSLTLTQMGKDELLVQLYAAPVQDNLRFKCQDGLIVSVTGKAEELYRLSDKEIAAKKDAAQQTLLTKLEAELKRRNFTSKGLTLSIDEVTKLVGSGLENVRNKCKSLEDVMFYLAAAGSKQDGGDIQTADSERDFTWHFNYSPEMVYKRVRSNCGATARFVTYLLDGDYEEVGLVGMSGDNGGHVITWLRDGNTYKVADINSFHGTGCNCGSINFRTSTDLAEAARTAVEGCGSCKLGCAVKLLTGASDEGDMPVGWASGDNITRIPKEYKDGAIVFLETPAEGFHVEWVDVSGRTWDKINALRNG